MVLELLWELGLLNSLVSKLILDKICTFSLFTSINQYLGVIFKHLLRKLSFRKQYIMERPTDGFSLDWSDNPNYEI